MLSRFLGITTASFVLIGCAQPSVKPSEDEIWAAVQKCGGDEVCSKAEIVTLAVNKQPGKNFGQGVAIRGAQTDGRTVSIGIDIPAHIAIAPNKRGRTPEQQLADIVDEKFCSEDNIRRFIDVGGAVEAVFYPTSGSSGEPFSRHTVDEC